MTDQHSNRWRLRVINGFSTFATVAYNALLAATILFLLAPMAIIVVLSLQDKAYGGWPPEAFTLRWYREIPENFEHLGLADALTSSLILAVMTGVVATTIGTMAAFAIIRYEFKFSNTLKTILLSPLIYPWVVVGLAILIVIGRIRTIFGVNIPLSYWTVLAGHVLITMPFPMRTVGSSLQNFDTSQEEAAMNLGATELETYVKITLPLLKPGLISGFIFAFVLSFNQYIVTLFLSGPNVETVPLLLFSLFRNSPPAQLSAIATLLMLGMVVLVSLTEYFVGISRFL